MPTGKYKRTKPAWNKGLTKETSDIIAKADLKRQQTCLEKYGNTNVMLSEYAQEKCGRHDGLVAQKALNTIYNTYGEDAFKQFNVKAKQTKLEKYGDANFNNQEKRRATCLELYGVEHPNQLEEIRKKISISKSTVEATNKYRESCINHFGVYPPMKADEVKSKYLTTLFKNYGVDSPLRNKDIWERHIETMYKNHTFNTSKPEEDFYQLLVEQYGEDDIVRQYSDERYPFKCDFYIKSEDKFIELNYHPSHGFHPFDSTNPDDIALLESLILENSKWSQMIIDTWTVRDVKKFNIAKQNKLNYQCLYA